VAPEHNDIWGEFSPEHPQTPHRTVGVPEYVSVALSILIVIGIAAFWPSGSAKGTAAALPLTILFVLAQQSFGDVANSEIVAVEIVRALVGTIGIVAAVPLTTWMATEWPSTHTHHH